MLFLCRGRCLHRPKSGIIMFCSIHGRAGACSRRFEILKYTDYSPAANRFVGDAEPYGFYVNRAVFGTLRTAFPTRNRYISKHCVTKRRENTVLPYGVTVDFCCFFGMAELFRFNNRFSRELSPRRSGLPQANNEMFFFGTLWASSPTDPDLSVCSVSYYQITA